MPLKYKRMKHRFIRDGLSEQDAQTKAAKIFNAQRKPGERAVGPHREPGSRKKPG